MKRARDARIFFSFLLCGCISNLYVEMHILTHLLLYSMIHNSLCLRNLYLRATLRYKFTWESSFRSIEHMQFSKSSPLLVNGMILKSFAWKTSYVSEQLWETSLLERRCLKTQFHILPKNSFVLNMFVVQSNNANKHTSSSFQPHLDHLKKIHWVSYFSTKKIEL